MFKYITTILNDEKSYGEREKHIKENKAIKNTNTSTQNVSSLNDKMKYYN